MSWKTRTAVAVTTTAVLTAGGFALVANGSTGSPEPSPSVTTAASVDTTDLERSLDDLMAQVADLETTVAQNESVQPVDDHGGLDAESGAPSGDSTSDAAAVAPLSVAPLSVVVHDDGDDDGIGGRAEHEDDASGHEVDDD